MANIGHIEIEVKPTVTLESAEACVMMLNLFFADNDGYDLVCVNRGEGFKWELTNEPRPGIKTELSGLSDKVAEHFGVSTACLDALSNIPNPGSPQMTEEQQEAWNTKLRKLAGLETE